MLCVKFQPQRLIAWFRHRHSSSIFLLIFATVQDFCTENNGLATWDCVEVNFQAENSMRHPPRSFPKVTPLIIKEANSITQYNLHLVS
jgi:hypothetical protein